MRFACPGNEVGWLMMVMVMTPRTSMGGGLKVTTLFLMLVLVFRFLGDSAVQGDHGMSRHLSEQPPPSSLPGFRRIILSVGLGVLTGLIGVVLFTCLVRSFVHYMNRTPVLEGPVIFSLKISPNSLQAALENESDLLESSPNRQYRHTVLDNGLTVAVKRIELADTGSPVKNQRKSLGRRVQRELKVLAGLRHVNLMSPRAYVFEPELNRVLLVYDFMANGSLEDAMKRVREDGMELAWDARLLIAVGVIKGLQYLHFGCYPQVLHYNVKLSNVMLDVEFRGRLADCGLAKLALNSSQTSSYSAPECLQNLRYTDKIDVFGMILGVLLTGRDPADPFFSEAESGGSLGRWLKHLLIAGEAKEALDKRILGEEVEEDEMQMALRIAVECLSKFPADRPSSDELVPVLTQLQRFRKQLNLDESEQW